MKRTIACLSMALAASTAAAAEENWRVVSLNGKPVAQGQEATITLTPDRMSGKAFCNRYSVEIQSKRGIRIVGPAASTRMACPPALMALERDFLSILMLDATINIEEGMLTIRRPGSGSIRATRAG
jgi:heat shock protein HslJ